MFSIPPLEDWGPVHFTMAAYVIQGIVITLLNVPLIIMLLFKKKNRDRKEFVLIACVSLIDIFYVIVNAWNSFIRLMTISESITRAACNTHPMYFISLVVSQLVANMPLMVALDRLIATLYGVWYYKQRHFYSLMLCAIPIAFSFLITLINLIIILTTSAGEDKVINFCFSSSLPAPVYKFVYHGLKWFCIFLAAAIYCLVAYKLKTKTTNVSTIQAKRVATANLVMGLSTINSIIFHLIPDFLLVVPLPFLTVTVFVQCILFSLILEKIMFNFVLFLVFHNELRSLYCGIFFRSNKKEQHRRGTSSSGNVPTTGTSRMFASQANSCLLTKIALRIRSRFSQ